MTTATADISGTDTIVVRDPYHGETLTTLRYAGDDDIAGALRQARDAFAVWSRTRSHERSALLLRLATALHDRQEEFARLITAEAGKPITYARAEVARSITVFQWAAAEALRFAGELVRTDAESFGRAGFGIHGRVPRGVLLGITPYNWPLLTVAHKVAPALAVGCTMVVKPSIFTPMTVLRLAEVLRDCGAIDGLMPVVLADDAHTAELTRAPEVAMVTFTGSPGVGALIRSQSTDRPVTLELGGNAWVGVLPDVDPASFPHIVKRIAATGYGYAGQGCLSVQNIAVWHPEADRFIELLCAATRGAAYGDTGAPEVICGPVINRRAAERINRELDLASGSGSVVRSVNQIGTPAPGYADLLIPPSLVVLDELPSSASITEEEIFGPVVTVSRFAGVNQFIDQVNASRFGLQTGIFTDHWPSIERIYREVHVGAVMVNDVSTLRYDHVPFGGGILDSGQGREGVTYAMQEMTQSRFLSVSSALPFASPDAVLRPPPAAR